ncbi:MAG TPA: penicillin-binding protein 2 [Candidatus Tumulicola sp.]|nr:penicillin-binding protein 2 [Candidatus Tumulicola sp.]
MKQKERTRLRARAVALFACFILVTLGLGSRLWFVQIRGGQAWTAYAGTQQRGKFDVSGRRGSIVDRFGIVFAATVPAVQIFAQPPDVKDARNEAAVLAPLLKRPEKSVLADLTSPEPFVYLARNAPKAVGQTISKLDLPGVGVKDEATGAHVDPQGHIGSTVIGFTGDDNQGLAGIEHTFNDVLAGKAGRIVADTDSQDRIIPFGQHMVDEPVVGDTVVLTIDRALQLAAEDVLSKTATKYNAASAVAIVMRVSTGEILALANWPDYDPNHWKSFGQDAYRNRAIADPYEPGSTFKIVTATAALDSAKVSLDDTFPAVDRLDIGGYVIHNADDGLVSSGRSREPLADIIAFSHNVGAAEVALHIGKTTMGDYIKRFGFDDVTGIDLSGESAGIGVSSDEWFGSRRATVAFGQGVSVTAIAIARAYAAVANGGLLMRPLIVRQILSPSGRVIKQYTPDPVRRVMRPQTAAKLLAMLRDVVKRGTGSNAQIAGYAVAGKTGTAQIVEAGGYMPGEYVASFVGIVPADKPQYVVLVNVERPRGAYYGGVVAAPAFRELARRVLWREGVLPKRADGADDALSPANDAKRTKRDKAQGNQGGRR